MLLGATDGEVEREDKAEEESEEPGEVDRGAHRCACGYEMDVGEGGWFLLLVAQGEGGER